MFWIKWFDIIFEFYSLSKFFLLYKKKEESIAGEAAKLTEIGGNYGGNVMPTPFLCLLLKMLQLQPDPDIIKLYISQETSKLVFFSN